MRPVWLGLRATIHDDNIAFRGRRCSVFRGVGIDSVHSMCAASMAVDALGAHLYVGGCTQCSLETIPTVSHRAGIARRCARDRQVSWWHGLYDVLPIRETAVRWPGEMSGSWSSRPSWLAGASVLAT